MNTVFSNRLVLAGIAAVGLAGSSQALEVEVEITNNSPTGGVVLTPVWVGFHDGSFDSYNGGLSAQVGLERLAEDGDNSVISSDFLGGYTYIDNSGSSPVSARVLTSQTTGRVDGTIGSPTGPGPIQPGETETQRFTIGADGSNRYFSYASMILPSNDFFLANGSPTAFDLASLYDGVGEITFQIGLPGTANDAGTEQEDFDFAAPPLGGLQAFFPGVGFDGTDGQAAPNQSSADNTLAIQNVVGDPFADFLNADGLDLSQLNFNDNSLYTNGIATITIRAVPEPGSLTVLGLGGLALISRRRRR
ncbi:MAG: spondin domain-containing protein [Planctomycetota bacterium]